MKFLSAVRSAGAFLRDEFGKAVAKVAAYPRIATGVLIVLVIVAVISLLHR